jgi:hypothetical protein
MFITTQIYAPSWVRVVAGSLVVLALLDVAERRRVARGRRLVLAIPVIAAMAWTVERATPTGFGEHGELYLWAAGAILAPPLLLAVATGVRRPRLPIEPPRPARHDRAGFHVRMARATALAVAVHAGVLLVASRHEYVRTYLALVDVRRGPTHYGDGIEMLADGFVMSQVIVFGALLFGATWWVVAEIFRRGAGDAPLARWRRASALAFVLVAAEVAVNQVGSNWHGPGWQWQLVLGLAGPPAAVGAILMTGRSPGAATGVADRPKPDLFGVGPVPPAVRT